MHRFFISKKDIKKDSIIITDDNAAHINKVLRLKKDDKIVLCDGEGIDYIARIDAIEKYGVKSTILNKEKSLGEAKIDITIYQGIPKFSKMDLIIQKATEIGAMRIVPVLTKRTVVKLSSKKDELKKVQRWQRISEEAAKQSNRGIIPFIDMPRTLDEALEDSSSMDLSLIPYEEEKDLSLKKAIAGTKPRSMAIFIGPEGGFEPDEIENAVDRGVIKVSLGNRILRTETAGLVVLSCIMYEFDEI